ncbi:inositol-pentakisphosphate 2-kinase [Exophiala viscosa]|uniref:inositol-pentakisphosphate 2-kinase n=1 Tax=Exophiala viscosa TaxID=2486360 RepID=UPI00219B6CC1|nr:inositol-pentakisphosphate 2-kinase [Exophiala viscosa]
MTTEHQSLPSRPSALGGASLELHYLAEGAANIIYSVSVTSPAPLQAHSHCYVMRLRKDLPSTKPAVQTMSDFRERIVPLFAGHEALLMEQALYELNPEMIEAANRELVEMDSVDLSALSINDVNAQSRPNWKIRHHHRRHVYLPPYEEEQYGILMPNLHGPGIDWLVEFKPKWLVQSPSAPRDARNCRTCALNAMRRRTKLRQGRGDSGFCPMDLLESGNILEGALANIWPMQEGVQAFAATFKAKVQPVLSHLKALQQAHRSVGLEDFQTPAGKDFGLAMALRDCSVFLVLRRRDEGGGVDLVDVKLADLDLKTTDGGKVQKWARMEQELLDGGWYYSAEDSNCALSRHKS